MESPVQLQIISSWNVPERLLYQKTFSICIDSCFLSLYPFIKSLSFLPTICWNMIRKCTWIGRLGPSFEATTYEQAWPSSHGRFLPNHIQSSAMPTNNITQNDMKRMRHIWMHKVQISANLKHTQVLEMAIQIHILATQNVLDFLFQVTYGNLTYMSLQWTLSSKVANTTQTLKSIQKLNWTCEFLSKEYKNLSNFKKKNKLYHSGLSHRWSWEILKIHRYDSCSWQWHTSWKWSTQHVWCTSSN